VQHNLQDQHRAAARGNHEQDRRQARIINSVNDVGTRMIMAAATISAASTTRARSDWRGVFPDAPSFSQSVATLAWRLSLAGNDSTMALRWSPATCHPSRHGTVFWANV
jgi:hypothetical protein